MDSWIYSTYSWTAHEEQTANNPAQLDPSQQFMEKLRLQQSALKATSEADLDRRLRRALLQKFTGQVRILNTGDKCYYWRDSPAGAGTKLRWKGPAIVVMRESSPKALLDHMIAHGAVLLRAAPEHVKPADPRPVVDESSTPLDRAKQALQQVRGRGVTQFIDLPKSNKRKRLEIDSDEEEEDLDIPPALAEDDQPLLQDEWSTSHEGRYWIRHHHTPRKALYVPDPEDGMPVYCFGPSRVTNIQRLNPAPESTFAYMIGHPTVLVEKCTIRGPVQLHFECTRMTTLPMPTLTTSSRILEINHPQMMMTMALEDLVGLLVMVHYFLRRLLP